MNKFKHDIAKKHLSWERKKTINICDYENCIERGEYKAPISRLRLNEYYLFCLKHVKIYNKSWDFYRGLNVDQIELSIRKDAIWDRPSWPLKGHRERDLWDRALPALSELLHAFGTWLDPTLNARDNDMFSFPGALVLCRPGSA